MSKFVKRKQRVFRNLALRETLRKENALMKAMLQLHNKHREDANLLALQYDPLLGEYMLFELFCQLSIVFRQICQ